MYTGTYKKVLFCLMIALVSIAAGNYALQHRAPEKASNSLQKVTIAQAFDLFLYAPLYVAMLPSRRPVVMRKPLLPS